jgi:mono/diheme cytochrome c family protein
MLKRMIGIFLPIVLILAGYILCQAAEHPLPKKNAAPLAVADKNGNATLYNANCALCHGQAKRGEPAARIGNAIRKNIGGMGSLKFLTPEQIRTITDF